MVGRQAHHERLTWILRQADWGAPLQLFDAYESTVLADGHTRGLYEQRLDKVRVDWTWRAGDARPGSQQAAEELADATQQIDKEGASGILRTVAWWGRCSSMSVRDWLIFAEKFGIPMIVGKPASQVSMVIVAGKVASCNVASWQGCQHRVMATSGTARGPAGRRGARPWRR